MSLSARRAWIEISDIDDKFGGLMVALRKESVDRNLDIRYTTSPRPRSLSARRAWIEMMKCQVKKYSGLVALRKESVDRNFCGGVSARRLAVALRKESVDRNFIGPLIFSVQARRSPQGERG